MIVKKICTMFLRTRVIIVFFLSAVLLTLCVLSSIDSESGESSEISEKIESRRLYTTDTILLAVATEKTDGFKRFVRSAEKHSVPYEVLGLGRSWGSFVVRVLNSIGFSYKKHSIGFGSRIKMLHEYLEPFKNDSKKIIVVTDCYDLMLAGSLEKIVDRFKEFDARIVFSAERFCWPDSSLASKYPASHNEKPYLNAGGYIGFAPELYQITKTSDLSNWDDDQLFYTKAYLDEKLRTKLNMKLDHESKIFHSLFGAVEELELRFSLKTNDGYLYNTVSGMTPLVIHGNGRSKQILDKLGNYLEGYRNPKDG